MKKVIFSALLIAFAPLNAMEEKALTFTRAQHGDDLSAYKEILLKVYPEYAANSAIKEYIKEVLPRSLAVLTTWIGQKGKLFIKAQDNETPVGFITLESLNEEATHIAFHQSPLLPEHLDKISQYFDQVKKEFPHAKVVYTACSDKVPKMQELVKRLGFIEDSNYLPTKELVPNPVGFQGYRKSLE